MLIEAFVESTDRFTHPPSSIARPIFLRILKYLNCDKQRNNSDVMEAEHIGAFLRGEILESEVSPLLLHLAKICRNAEVPPNYIEIICRLTLMRHRADVVDDAAPVSESMLNIAKHIVQAFLQSTMGFDLVVLVLDDVVYMDKWSWKIVELLHDHSHNLLVMTTTPHVTMEEIHADKAFWERLHDVDAEAGIFTEISLEATGPDAIRDMAGMLLSSFQRIDEAQTKDTGSMVETSTESGQQVAVPDVENIGELVLQSLDALKPLVRTHLNLGAILGSTFELMDVVTVFEHSRGVTPDEREAHAQSVQESLEEAASVNILVVENQSMQSIRFSSSDHPFAAQNVTYKFAHDVWRSNILRLTLNEWKKDMHSLIAQSMETAMDSQLSNDYRLLTKLFCHWKESGSAKKAASLALKMGRSLEDIGLTHQSLIVYRESLDMWKAMDSNGVADESIGGRLLQRLSGAFGLSLTCVEGLSMQLLEELESDDVELLIKLNVALGRCYTNLLEQKESVNAYQTALNVSTRIQAPVLETDVCSLPVTTVYS